MMNLFIDTTLECMTFSHVISDNNNIIFFLIYIIMLLLGIILLASIPQLLDTEADYQQRKLLKSEKPTIVIDLYYVIKHNQLGNNSNELFVYDKLDPSGVRMFNLFGDRFNTRGSYNGYQGFNGMTEIKLNVNRELPMEVSPVNLFFIERNGGAILSNGLAIGKEVVSAPGRSSTSQTRLLVKKG